MDIGKEGVDHYEMMIWDTLTAVSNCKKNVKSTPAELKEELRILQNELMEASEWMNKNI